MEFINNIYDMKLKDIFNLPYEERVKIALTLTLEDRADLYQKGDVMYNKLGCEDLESLTAAEKIAVNTSMTALEAEMNEKPLDISYVELLNINRRILGSVYDWAGTERLVNLKKAEPLLQGRSVNYEDWKMIRLKVSGVLNRIDKISYDKNDLPEYKEMELEELTECFAELWRCHPFREGNTRTCTTFIYQAALQHGINLNYQFTLPDKIKLRDALVLGNDPLNHEKTRFNALYNILAASVQGEQLKLKEMPMNFNMNVAKERMEADLKSRQSGKVDKKHIQTYSLI